MPEVRYQVPGVPPVPALGLTAFTPAFVRHAASGAQSYKYAVAGYPGTRSIPAPTGNTQMSPDVGDKAQGGTGASSDAPDAWWPNQYYQRFAVEWPGAGQAVAVYDPVRPGRTSVLPIPAEDYRGGYTAQSARLSRRAVLQRIRELPWFPRNYRAQGGSYNG